MDKDEIIKQLEREKRQAFYSGLALGAAAGVVIGWVWMALAAWLR
jgi:hypothetical protein